MPSITLTATQEDYDKSLPGFLHEHAVPTVNGVPTMSEGAWVKQWLMNSYYREAKQGLSVIAGEAVTLNNVFE